MNHLTNAAQSYALSRSLAPDYSRQIQSRCKAFEDYHGAPVSVEELQNRPELLSNFLQSLEASGLAPPTVRGYRACIAAVWEFALPAGSHVPTRDIRHISRTQPPPECWTADELRQLFKTAAKQPGARHDAGNWSDWWTAATLTAYSTGLRLGDLLRLRRNAVRPDRRLTVIQNKTQKPVAVQIEAQAIKAALRLPESRLLLPWPYSIETLRKRFRLLVEEAEIRPGTFKWLRRSAGSHLERVNPGQGHNLLGNSRDIFTKHYADPSITQPQVLAPPSLVN